LIKALPKRPSLSEGRDKAMQDNKKTKPQKIAEQNPVIKENQNQQHNTKKEALGPNTRR